MQRRAFLLSTGAALGLSAFAAPWVHAAAKRQKILYFTRSAGFEHSGIKRKGSELSFTEKLLTAWGTKQGFDVHCTKDGRVFDDSLDGFDAIAFYTSGVLTEEDKPGKPVNGADTKPMSVDGKKHFLEAIAAGKGFIGFHSASDTFHSVGDRLQAQTEVDPYIAMLGGEFIHHGAQQKSTLSVASPKFPGLTGIASSLSFQEEWYALKNFAKDLHVILAMETAGMQGEFYQRPSYPNTWARMHNKGRVYFTALGHREDVWTNPDVEKIMLGGLSWVLGNSTADLTQNIDTATPHAGQLPKINPKTPAKPADKKAKKQ